MTGLPWRSRLLALGLVLSANAAAAMDTSAWKFDAPSVLDGLSGAAVHGSVCRLSPSIPAALSGVRIEHVDAGGRVLASSTARASRELAGRDVGCAFYDRQTPWRLGAGERVRVCAAGAGACPAG